LYLLRKRTGGGGMSLADIGGQDQYAASGTAIVGAIGIRSV
jgi:hypothetical protein